MKWITLAALCIVALASFDSDAELAQLQADFDKKMEFLEAKLQNSAFWCLRLFSLLLLWLRACGRRVWWCLPALSDLPFPLLLLLLLLPKALASSSFWSQICFCILRTCICCSRLRVIVTAENRRNRRSVTTARAADCSCVGRKGDTGKKRASAHECLFIFIFFFL
jgi:hypothetical protein